MGGNLFMTKTRSKKSRDTVPLSGVIILLSGMIIMLSGMIIMLSGMNIMLCGMIIISCGMIVPLTFSFAQLAKGKV